MTDQEENAQEQQAKSAIQYVLYKLDRTFAILGIIGIAMGALILLQVADAQQIAIAAIGVLGGYVGGRSGK